ncbi:PTS glucose/sucrose transporter subunit IIB [Gleimia hominis]|uniref:PTS glucose/sucrose transporter subunit IIB n=1 Tax=Gleimia hominis TaxID=595468 RepID=A0ABU3IAP3_9ACTO|nr:PTS glucose/sucrose transporter subunit IIB [Gleimia hominis]MDT3767447.1 PTS glucose/sucrose transporter subunit IIB [Gleimia hominis]
MGAAYEQSAKAIVEGLGGADNIASLQACITRIRARVNDVDRVNDETLKAAGAFGVVKVGPAVQIVVGPDADDIAASAEPLLK